MGLFQFGLQTGMAQQKGTAVGKLFGVFGMAEDGTVAVSECVFVFWVTLRGNAKTHRSQFMSSSELFDT